MQRDLLKRLYLCEEMQAIFDHFIEGFNKIYKSSRIYVCVYL